MDNQTAISCEFFPPHTDAGLKNLTKTCERLSQMKPDFYSVTYGASGADQNKTKEAVLQMRSATAVESAPHITCIGSSKAGIAALLDEYRAQGIKRLVALRGDLPKDQTTTGEFTYASDLIAFIRQHSGDHFHLEVACYPETHPEAKTPNSDLKHFLEKVNSGANSAITQYFFNPDAYFDFMDSVSKVGLDVPVVPGIMPITNYKGLTKFSDACGAEIPRWIRLKLAQFQDDEVSLNQFGADVVTALCDKLIAGGAPGLHFYTMNKAEPTLKIWGNLALT